MRIASAAQRVAAVAGLGLSAGIVSTTFHSRSAVMCSAMSVPDRMSLSQSLKDSLPALYKAPLVKLDFSRDATTQEVIVREQDETSLGGAVSHPSVCFVVRRPG